MLNPSVSFVVPCYKLAHLLSECISSILSQTYDNFEVLIMDDCSPDNTMEVSKSFHDQRIKYIRNDKNLGHLANYNKGIQLSHGQYVWLISADDRLRCTYVLNRYVKLLEDNLNIGFIFCPGIGLVDNKEVDILHDCGYFGTVDKIFKGKDFIAESLKRGYGILAPSVLVRKTCYDNISYFPLDLPHQGDLYLWYLWALEYDVVYLCEPMVNYRIHNLNIMKELIDRGDIVFKDEVAVLWRIKEQCNNKCFYDLVDKFENALSWKYARAVAAYIYADDSYYLNSGKNIEECKIDIKKNTLSNADYRRILWKFLVSLGNQHWRHGSFSNALQNYYSALGYNWKLPTVWLKIFILIIGLGRIPLLLKNISKR